MDKSLDEIISARPKARRGIHRRRSGGGARSQILGNAPSVSTAARAKASVAGTKATGTQVAGHTEKIMVSNLPPDVNEQQVKDLFSQTVGPLKTVTLHYDSNGRSKGVAAVLFQKAGDANKAYEQYNNRLIDGKRPMKIEMVVDPTRPAASVPLASRVAPAPNGTAPAARGGGARRGGRGGRRKKTERTPKSAADLDAEMEDYTANTTTVAA